jgi:hypothetical protein
MRYSQVVIITAAVILSILKGWMQVAPLSVAPLSVAHEADRKVTQIAASTQPRSGSEKLEIEAISE